MNGYRDPQDLNFIDLVSDDEDELEYLDADDEEPGAADDFPDMDGMYDGYDEFNPPAQEVDRDFIDLTNIPDIDVPPSDAFIVDSDNPTPEAADEGNELVTEAIGLQMVMDFLPGISIDHVLGIFREKTNDDTRTSKKCQDIISQLVEAGDYPKEDEEANKKKRKRSDEDDWKDYEAADRDPAIVGYEDEAQWLLRDEFPSVPARHVANVIKDHKTLFKSYLVLENQVRNYGRIANQFSNIRKARPKKGAELMLIERGSQLPRELQMAKSKVENEMAKRRKAEEAEQAEVKNLEDAQKNGLMGECACCFDDVPLNRMISCSGATTHSYCKECPKRQIETQMGMSNCRPTCFGVDDCDGTFSRQDLQLVLGMKTFDRLEHLQQQQDLAAAGLDFLSECPFCDFKMECLPVDVDKEFRCQNPKCRKTSCRLCDKETHIPLSCEEASKDGQITLRHIVEEAMSAALIRQCNKCKHPFIKELGCNKMSCSHCRNLQCYVCSKDVADYNHFGEIQKGKCPLHDNVEDRHEQEVKKAADEAMAKVRAEHPDLSDADLMIQVSDRVKQAEKSRKANALAEANGFPYHMVGGNVQRRPGPAGIPHVMARGMRNQPGMAVPAANPPAVEQPAAQYVPVQPQALFGGPMPAPPYPDGLNAPPFMLPPMPQPIGYAAYMPFRFFAAQPQPQLPQVIAPNPVPMPPNLQARVQAAQAAQQAQAQALAAQQAQQAQAQAQAVRNAQAQAQRRHQQLQQQHWYAQMAQIQPPRNDLQAPQPQQENAQLDADRAAQRLRLARQLDLHQRLRQIQEQQARLAQQGEQLQQDNGQIRNRMMDMDEHMRRRDLILEARLRALGREEGNQNG